MPWAKIKTSAIAGASLLLAAGAIAIPPAEPLSAASPYDSIWQNPDSSSLDRLDTAPPTLIVRPTQFPNSPSVGIGMDKAVYINQSLPYLLANAYDIDPWRMALPDDLPVGNYDYLATLPERQNNAALRKEIQKQFGLIAGKREERETGVYLLQVKDAAKLQSHLSKAGNPGVFWGNGQGETFSNEPLSESGSEQNLRYVLECDMKQPILDRTGSHDHYDIEYQSPRSPRSTPASQVDKVKAVNDQLDNYGLELVPAREKIKMLVVDRVK
jgi:uncharacterized protein (TIGR03435 family)